MTKWKTIKRFARDLRKNPTYVEEKFWYHLRGKQLEGYKFLRQHPIVYRQKGTQKFFFIADFYCADMDLVIELDGKVHELQKEYDYNRNLVLNGLGLKVLRIQNKELKDLESVKRKILTYLK